MRVTTKIHPLELGIRSQALFTLAPVSEICQYPLLMHVARLAILSQINNIFSFNHFVTMHKPRKKSFLGIQ